MALLASNRVTLKLSRAAFWDIDLEKLDLERFADFAIIRIF
jgi:hypothetical protein